MSLLTTKQLSEKIGISERNFYRKVKSLRQKYKRIKRHEGSFYTIEEAKKITQLLGYDVTF